MACFYNNSLKLQGLFLEYAVRFLQECASTFLYIPLFFVFLAGLIALFVFQHLAFSSKWVTAGTYWNWAGPGFLGVLNIL
jgi:hypothetical protein